MRVYREQMNLFYGGGFSARPRLTRLWFEGWREGFRLWMGRFIGLVGYVMGIWVTCHVSYW